MQSCIIPKIAIYGGNGFVGCNVAKALVAKGATVICISRTGNKPAHLQKRRWSDAVQWVQGDASEPDPEHLRGCSALICLVGSPPIPVIGKRAIDNQVFKNGATNIRAIAAGQKAGVKRLVLLGAKIPKILNKGWFGYAKGKELSALAAMDFADFSDEHSAVVIQPGGIFGKRHMRSGREVPIDLLLGPASKIFSSQLISVETVANRIANEALSNAEGIESFEIVKHDDI